MYNDKQTIFLNKIVCVDQANFKESLGNREYLREVEQYEPRLDSDWYANILLKGYFFNLRNNTSFFWHFRKCI